MRRRVLAVSSAGGHWSQLMLLREALAEQDVTFVTTLAGLGEVSGVPTEIIPDSNRNTRSAIFQTIAGVWRVFRRVRPDVVISTGALPGLIAIALGRLLGKRTIWIESIANASELSMSGRYAARIADRFFVQWPELAVKVGGTYAGAVL